MLIIRVLNQLEFSEIYLDLVIMVLVAPQPKAERRCKTLNINDIRCFSLL